MHTITEKIADVVEPAVEAEGYLLVDVEFTSGPGGGILRLYIDRSEGGITLDDCEQVSRLLSPLLDVENIIEGKYYLEISSPGINRRIRKKSDFEKFAGNKVKVHLRSPLNGRKKITGTIEGVDGKELLVSEGPAKPQMRIPLENILRANLQIL